MLWNDLSYDTQLKIMEIIEETLLHQTDENLQDGMVAALTELEIWSHAPIISLEEEPYVAQAQFVDDEWDRIVDSFKN